MTYVSWAALYEGPTDQAYFDVLVPRVMEDIVLTQGIRNSTIPGTPAVRLSRGTVAAVANEACESRDAFHLVFIHSDTGGRNQEADLHARSEAYCEAMHAVCEWPRRRCVAIAPRHEMEAWLLADPNAITSALGFIGDPTDLGLPVGARQAERLQDPKAVLGAAMRLVRGRRRRFEISQILPAVAQRQSLALLRRSNSFRGFEGRLTGALADLGCV